MTISPQQVSIALIVLIGLAVAAALIWGLRPGKAARPAGPARKPPVKGVKGSKGAKSSQPVKAAAKPAKAPAPAKAVPANQRKYGQARTRFVKSLEKRIGREPLIGDRLKKTRDLVLGWYDQGGKVARVRYQAKDTRTACKVCVGRHNKEYDLLSADVVARILPPSHSDGAGRHDCECWVMPVLAGE